MLIRLFSVTVTNYIDRYSYCFSSGGHGGHSGHGVSRTYTRACAYGRTRLKSIIQLITTSCVYINTMTTMTTMTRVIKSRVVAVTVDGHSKSNYDQLALSGVSYE